MSIASNNESKHTYRINDRVNTVLQLLDDSKEFNPKNYLDLGCGNGDITSGLSTELNISNSYCADITVPEYKYQNLNYLHIDPNNNYLDIPDSSIELITAFVSLHHIKNLKEMISELDRISIQDNTYLIIREHDCISYIQPYLDFIHLLELIKYNNLDFENYVGNYYNRINLQRCLESHGWEYIKSIDYPSNISNPQRLYSSIFLFKGIKNEWTDPIIIKTKYTLQNDSLFTYINNINSNNELNNYIKVLYKHGINKKIAYELLKCRSNMEFVKKYINL